MAGFLVIPNDRTGRGSSLASAEDPPTIFVDNGNSYSMEGHPRTDLLGVLNNFDKRGVPREDQLKRLVSTSTILTVISTLGNDNDPSDARLLERYREMINA